MHGASASSRYTTTTGTTVTTYDPIVAELRAAAADDDTEFIPSTDTGSTIRWCGTAAVPSGSLTPSRVLRSGTYTTSALHIGLLRQRALWRTVLVAAGSGSVLIDVRAQLPPLKAQHVFAGGQWNRIAWMGSSSLTLAQAAQSPCLSNSFVLKLLVGEQLVHSLLAVGADLMEHARDANCPQQQANVSPARRPLSALRRHPCSARRCREPPHLPAQPLNSVAAAASLFALMGLLMRGLASIGALDALTITALGTAPVNSFPGIFPPAVERVAAASPAQEITGVLLERLTTKGSRVSKSLITSHVVRAFTDAEVFQLLYLQLVLRAFLDIAVLRMETSHESRAATLRAESIGVRSADPSSFLIFEGSLCSPTVMSSEHSAQASYLVFPPGSPTLVLLEYSAVAHSHFAGCAPLPDEQLLWGTTVPCVGPLGKEVMEWARGVRLRSRADAATNLDELFARFAAKYGASAHDVEQLCAGVSATTTRQSAAPLTSPRLFSCSKRTSALLRLRLPELMAELPCPFSAEAQGRLDGEMLSVTTEHPGDDLPHPSDTYVPTVSPTTTQVGLVSRWRSYLADRMLWPFFGDTSALVVTKKLGSGGSGLVMQGYFGARRIPVAIKCFFYPDGMTVEEYVRESLTDVAFFVLFNQMDDYRVCHGVRAHDFVISKTPPVGMAVEDVRACLRKEPDDGSVPLCYLVTDLMSGTLGRFKDECDEDWDPGYDELVTSPTFAGFTDCDIFQFLYVQLVCRAVFDYVVHDVMLNQQLRVDNLGFRWLADVDPTKTLLRFQLGADRIVQFESQPRSPLRLVFFIDVGQGRHEVIQQLSADRVIGETVVESCVVDDGMGRYWPPDALYAKHVPPHPHHECCTDLGHRALAWASEKRVTSQQDAFDALVELFDHFAGVYGPVESGEPESALVFKADEGNIADLRRHYVYRGPIVAEDSV